ncbi:MAG: hypothetical protein J7L95_06185 [Prolixibacteraceae bacterium]|nr:hypothetical protein [Prolixibacteraceae bacterium]
MKRSVFMLLNKGDSTVRDSIEAANIQIQHLSYLDQLVRQGKLLVAGLFEESGNHRGLLIFDVETVADALKLEDDVPAVKSGQLKSETFYWWGQKGRS